MKNRMVLEIELAGHLLDEKTLSQVLELIHDHGGHFEIRHLEAGAPKHEHSNARVAVFDASDALLEALETSPIVTRIQVGEPETDVCLETIDVAGAAPLEFYPTTIFPTDIRLDGHWIRVEDTRMDACIVVERGSPARARCKLVRDLVTAEEVVVGLNQGIRLQLPVDDDDEHHFKFMSAGVSSERRVEARVDQLAAEMQDMKAGGRRIAIVAGPVVVHTGGVEALSAMIRGGFVHLLLGGNAIAVHDIERDFFGTSLGVDLKTGEVVGGGHSHHIRAINQIRRVGGIEQAVGQGLIKSGVMKALVDNGVPYVLAGSIRDDGPLPDTIMDLNEAQRQYQKQLHGIDMILMLSTMLHSIGVGNMTPSGVKMICVDINPAVATKLADRGSLESVGIVTDVGLFLRLLAEKLGL